MSALLDWLQSTAFVIVGTPVSVIEIIGFVTGAACVYGVAKQHLWNWPVGIVNNAAFFFLFLGTGLFADATLQVIFAVLAVYGWYRWVRGRKDTAVTKDLPITHASSREMTIMAFAVIAFTGLIAWILHSAAGSTIAIPDSFILAGSLGATLWQAQKKMQHWWLWIVVNVVSVPLYISRGLVLTAILYVIFTGLCIYGLIDWKKEARQQWRPQTA
jgi:nicotinamide mononucleotide transporter